MTHSASFAFPERIINEENEYLDKDIECVMIEQEKDAVSLSHDRHCSCGFVRVHHCDFSYHGSNTALAYF